MRKLLVFAAFASLAVAVAACTGNGDDDDDGSSPSPTASPTPTATAVTSYDFTIGATNWPHATGGVRVLEGTNVVFCTHDLNVAGTDFTVTSAGLLAEGSVYKVEVFGDAGTTADILDAATDHQWVFDIPAVSADYTNTFDHNATGQSPLSWTDGTGCPGT